MTSRIPVTALLGLSLTSCGDDSTLVGDWRLVSLGGDRIPEESLPGYEWPLHIESDLSGEFVRYQYYDGMRSVESRYELHIDASDAPHYVIDWLYEDGELVATLDCTLDGDTLDCNIDGFGYVWERDP